MQLLEFFGWYVQVEQLSVEPTVVNESSRVEQIGVMAAMPRSNFRIACVVLLILRFFYEPVMLSLDLVLFKTVAYCRKYSMTGSTAALIMIWQEVLLWLITLCGRRYIKYGRKCCCANYLMCQEVL